MNAVAVTQRVTVKSTQGERRDCLDQLWVKFLVRCGLLPVPVPNEVDAAIALCSQVPVRAVVLTGGNDLVAYGGDAPERDATETAILEHAERQSCRYSVCVGECR